MRADASSETFKKRPVGLLGSRRVARSLGGISGAGGVEVEDDRWSGAVGGSISEDLA